MRTINKISDTQFEIITPQEPMVETGTLDILNSQLDEAEQEKTRMENETRSWTDMMNGRISGITDKINDITTKITEVKNAGIMTAKEVEANQELVQKIT